MTVKCENGVEIEFKESRRQVTFKNIAQETVDTFYSMLARNDIKLCPTCPVCNALKTVFSR
ncbi:MAG: hypothetical protein CL873_04460 [Dehalococcoidales bacterium]|mgnify:CR=1 FL=1|jgi:hypothetical protein|nr:hypothetical protein [Dehalococcoidales bacterium]